MMTEIEMKAAVRKAQLIKIRERTSAETIEHWWGNCWPPINNLSSCGCKLLLVVL